MLTGIFKDRHNSRLGAPRAPELLLGRLLKAKSLDGAQFLCRASVGPFTVDYVCKNYPLIVEVADVERRLYGNIQLESRVQYLAELGYRVVQFSRNEVLHFPDKVIARVREALEELRTRAQQQASSNRPESL